MYSFKNLEIPAGPINPVFGGTPNIFLKRIEYTEPEGRTPRLEMLLERRLPDGKRETSILSINDYTIQSYYKDINEQAQDELARYFNFLEVYRPDLTVAQINELIGDCPSWKIFTQKMISLLPVDFQEIETTWYLYYAKGTDFLKLGNKYPSVKRGTGLFKMNPRYDLMQPTLNAVAPPTSNYKMEMDEDAIF